MCFLLMVFLPDLPDSRWLEKMGQTNPYQRWTKWEEFQDRIFPISGSISRKNMKKIVPNTYEIFNYRSWWNIQVVENTVPILIFQPSL